MAFTECAECSRPSGATAAHCQTLHRVELKSRIAPMCCECTHTAVRKRTAKSSVLVDSWSWQTGSCGCCRKRKRDKCSGTYQKKPFSSNCVCGLTKAEHLSGMYEAGFSSQSTVIAPNGSSADGAPPLLTPRKPPAPPRPTGQAQHASSSSSQDASGSGRAPGEDEEEEDEVYDDVEASYDTLGIQVVPSPEGGMSIPPPSPPHSGFSIPSGNQVQGGGEAAGGAAGGEQARQEHHQGTIRMLAAQRDEAIVQIHQERGEYEGLAERYRAMEDQMESTVQHVVKVMGDDKKKLLERIAALEEAHDRVEGALRERDEALASQEKDLRALRKLLEKQGTVGKAAKKNLVAILDESQGEAALSKANTEVAKQQAARLASRLEAVKSYDPQVDELVQAIRGVEGRFASAVQFGKVMSERLNVATDQQLGEVLDNEELLRERSAAREEAADQLREALASRDLYKERFEALSDKMRKAGSALERLSAADASRGGGDASSNGGDHQWSVQQGGFKVLRARAGAGGITPRKDVSGGRAQEHAAPSRQGGGGVEGNTEIRAEELTGWVKVAEGTFGVVFRADWLSAPVAVKRLRLGEVESAEAAGQRAEMIADSVREVQRLVQLRHPNVLTFFGTVKEQGGEGLAIVTELMDRDMRGWLRSDAKTLPLEARLTVARQAACGLSYLHAQQLVHRDVKPENFLLKLPDTVKICDFGLSRLKQASKVSTLRTAGTLLYIAPEVHRGETFDERSDVYSFAVLLWEVLTLEMPFGDKPSASIPGIVGWGKQHPDLTSLDSALSANATPTLAAALKETVMVGWSHEAGARFDSREAVRRLDGALTVLRSSSRAADLRGTWNGRDAPRDAHHHQPTRPSGDWISFGSHEELFEDVEGSDL